jgi:hypothetical protein
MGTVAKWTAQVVAMVTPEVAAEIRAWAVHRRVSQSVAVREVIEAGLDVRRGAWIAQHGRIPAGVSRAAETEVADQVDRALRRKGRTVSEAA